MSNSLSTRAAKLGLSISLGLSAMSAYALPPSQPLATPAPVAPIAPVAPVAPVAPSAMPSLAAPIAPPPAPPLAGQVAPPPPPAPAGQLAPPPPPSLAGQLAPPPPPPPMANDPVASPVAQGQVKRMLINPFGEIDGMRLADGTIVKFPAHLGDDLIRIVKTGDTVRIVGRPEAAGIVKADAVINVASAQMIIDQPPASGNGRTLPPHLRAQMLKEQRVEGYVDTVLMGRRGETNGVILTDGSTVRFPPDSLSAPIRQGEPFAATGLGTSNTYGTSLEAISVGTKLSALQPLYNRAP